MTADEFHIDMVKTNLGNCDVVVYDAEICNKGRYAHDINQFLGILKPMVHKMKKKKPINVDKEELMKACRYMQMISCSLWLANRGK